MTEPTLHNTRHLPNTQNGDTNRIGASNIQGNAITQLVVNVCRALDPFSKTDPVDYTDTDQLNDSYSEYGNGIKGILQLALSNPFNDVSYSSGVGTDTYTINTADITICQAEVDATIQPNQNKAVDVVRKKSIVTLENGITFDIVIPATNIQSSQISFTLYDNATTITQTLKKYQTGTLTKTTLSSGELLIGSVVKIMYDGTDFIVLNPYIANPQVVIGDYKYSAQTTNHDKWLLCQGGEVSRTTYSALFDIIGTSFGTGDGSTTFNLPDARSSVLGAIGQRGGLTNRTIGSFIGEETHTLTVAEMARHKHSITLSHEASGNKDNSGFPAVDNDNTVFHSDSQSDNSKAYNNGTGNPLGSIGDSTPFNVMQPTLFIGNLFIYSGV